MDIMHIVNYWFDMRDLEIGNALFDGWKKDMI